ncbi:MAG TPA: sialidase family protein, partial [Anaerolineales bacterium]|nr:sialidase family protein [Anaerolineales bacterium]
MRTNLLALRTLVVITILVTAGVLTASAASYMASAPVPVSAATSPFTGCTADSGQVGTFSPDTEVEPWMEVNPADPDNIVASWQQDRWNNGGSRGLVAGVSTDGGANWTQVTVPDVSTCSGHPFYNRASDPWHSFSTDGSLYLMSLSTSTGITSAGFPDSAMLVSKSEDGGLSWGDPIALIADNGPNILNDKNSITADPNDSDFAYAVWDRLVIGAEAAPPVQVFGHAIGYHGPTWFARTTNGGDSWEPARKIYD